MIAKNNLKVEFGVVIGKSGSNIKVETAMDYVGGYCVALDLTARCLQVQLQVSSIESSKRERSSLDNF